MRLTITLALVSMTAFALATRSQAQALGSTYNAIVAGWDQGKLIIKLDDKGSFKGVTLNPQTTVIAYSGSADRQRLKRNMIVRFTADVSAENQCAVTSTVEIIGMGARAETSVQRLGAAAAGEKLTITGCIKKLASSGEFTVNAKREDKTVSYRCRLGEKSSFAFRSFPSLTFIKPGDTVEVTGSYSRRRFRRAGYVFEERNHGVIAATRISVTENLAPVQMGPITRGGFENRIENVLVGR